MKTLNRALLVLLALTLLASAYAMDTGMTQISIGHDTFYHMRWPWLHEVRQATIFGVLIWCLLFARSETLFVRIGLISLILAFLFMTLPPKAIHTSELPKAIWH